MMGAFLMMKRGHVSAIRTLAALLLSIYIFPESPQQVQGETVHGGVTCRIIPHIFEGQLKGTGGFVFGKKGGQAFGPGVVG